MSKPLLYKHLLFGFFIIVLLGLLFFLWYRERSTVCDCGDAPVVEEVDAGLANPASVYCEERGGSVDIRDTDEGEVGYCVFADGSECEEWSFYRGECVPGDSSR